MPNRRYQVKKFRGMRILVEIDGLDTVLPDREFLKGLSDGEIVTEYVDFVKEYFHSDYCFAVKITKPTNI